MIQRELKERYLNMSYRFAEKFVRGMTPKGTHSLIKRGIALIQKTKCVLSFFFSQYIYDFVEKRFLKFFCLKNQSLFFSPNVFPALRQQEMKKKVKNKEIIKCKTF